MTSAWIAGTYIARAEDPVPSEPQVKAAFLLNFPKYMEWPADAFAEASSPIVFATFGESSVGQELRKLIQGRTINGRPLVFKELSEADNSDDCHILFIPDSMRRRAPASLERLKGKSILTVGESDGFLEKGGIINLARRDRKIRLEVNLTAATQAGLRISSKLLGVADMVKGK